MEVYIYLREGDLPDPGARVFHNWNKALATAERDLKRETNKDKVTWNTITDNELAYWDDLSSQVTIYKAEVE